MEASKRLDQVGRLQLPCLERTISDLLPMNNFFFLDGTEAAPPEKVERSAAGSMKYYTVISFVPNPAYEAWLRKDQMVVSWLNTTLSEKILDNTIDLPSAHAI